jgi:O-antigen ligase
VGLVLVVASLSVAVTFQARPVPQVTGNFTSLQLSWGEIAAALLVLGWFVAALVAARRIGPGSWFVAAPGALLLGAAWIGVFAAIDPSLAAWNAARLTVAVGLGVVVANVAAASRLTAALLLVVGLHAAVGLMQFVTQHSLGLGWLGERHLAPGVADASTISDAQGHILLRAYGLAGSPNILGGVMATVLVLLAARVEPGWPRRMAITVGWAIGSLTLFATFSRGAWLGLAAGLVVAAAILLRGRHGPAMRRLGASVVVGAVVTLPLLVPFAPFLAARTGVLVTVPNETRSIEERLALNAETWAVLRECPLAGTGIGLLPIALAEAFPDSAYGRSPAHLVPLTAAAETGLLGAAAWIALAAAPWLALMTGRRRLTRDLAIASGGLAVLTVVGLFDYYPWGSPVGRLWWWAVLGLWVAAWGAAPRRGTAGAGHAG